MTIETNALKAQWIDNSLAPKENGKKNATRDVKPSKATATVIDN